MIKPDTIISCAAFIMFVITSVSAFLLLARSTPKIPIYFCGLLAITCLLWSCHGFMAHDVALAFGAGFGAFTSAIVFALRIYGNSQIRNISGDKNLTAHMAGM